MIQGDAKNSPLESTINARLVDTCRHFFQYHSQLNRAKSQNAKTVLWENGAIVEVEALLSKTNNSSGPIKTINIERGDKNKR